VRIPRAIYREQFPVVLSPMLSEHYRVEAGQLWVAASAAGIAPMSRINVSVSH
jgi:hypothetical protein